MQLVRKWNPNKKPLNYNNLFVIMFWTSLALGLFNIVALTCYIFVNPSDAKNIEFGQKLYLGFYEIIVVETNVGNLNPMAIVLGIFVIINTATCILAYWGFKNSGFFSRIDNVHVSSVLIVISVFICFLFLVNVFNRPIIDYKTLDIVKNGWNNNVNNENYVIKFNYVYDAQLINANGVPINTVFIFSGFFYIWVTLICIFWVILFVFFVTLFYNSNVPICINSRRI